MSDEPRKPGTMRIKDMFDPVEREAIKKEIRADPTISLATKQVMENFWVAFENHCKNESRS